MTHGGALSRQVRLSPSLLHLPIPAPLLHCCCSIASLSYSTLFPPYSSSQGGADWLDAQNKPSLQPPQNLFKPYFRHPGETRGEWSIFSKLGMFQMWFNRTRQTTWVLCVTVFLVGSGGERQRYETRVFVPLLVLLVISGWPPPALFHLYARPCNCDRNFPNEVSMEEQCVAFSLRAEFGLRWSQDISR